MSTHERRESANKDLRRIQAEYERKMDEIQVRHEQETDDLLKTIDRQNEKILLLTKQAESQLVVIKMLCDKFDVCE